MSVLNTLMTKVGPAFGILGVMFLVAFFVVKMWKPEMNSGVKTGLLVMLFTVEMGSAFVLPFGIGAGARDVFGDIWGATVGKLT